MSQTPDARDELIGELSRAIFLVDQATVPKGKAPHEAPDQVVGSLVIGGRLYQRILDAARHATNSGVERDTLAGIRNGLIAARMLLEDAGHWKNPSGYLTDAAMWIERALNEAHESDESMTNQVRSTDAAQVVGDKSRDEQKGLPMNPPTPEDLNRILDRLKEVAATRAPDFLVSLQISTVLLLIEEIERLKGENAKLIRLEKTADDLAWHNASKLQASEALSVRLRGALEEGRKDVRELLEMWPEGSVPPGPLCVRIADFVNGAAQVIEGEGSRADPLPPNQQLPGAEP